MNWKQAKAAFKAQYGFSPYFGGWIQRKPLHKWCIKVDFSSLHISRLLGLIQIANLLIVRLKWTSDKVVHKLEEWWLESARALRNLLKTRRDDCDAHAQEMCAVAEWCGFPRHPRPEDRTINHAWNLYPTEDGKDFYIIDTVGDRQVESFRLLSEDIRYSPCIACDMRDPGEYYVWTKAGDLIVAD